MVKSSKRGQIDNIITYEHICDTIDDLANIDPYQINLGSVAIVLSGESGGLEVYMSNSKKQWVSIMSNATNEENQND